MIDYEEFKELAKERFADYLPPEYRDWELQVVPMDLVNVTKDALCCKTDGRGRPIAGSPAVCVNDMHKRYLATGNMEDTLRAAADVMARKIEAMPEMFKREQLPAEEFIKMLDRDKIMCRLVNTEQNARFLETAPHTEFEDLSVIYYWEQEIGKEKVGITITDSMMKAAGLSTQELHNLAMENTKRLQPPVIMRMPFLNREICLDGKTEPDFESLFARPAEGEGLDGLEELEEMLREDRTGMWVLTNAAKSHGAISMLNEAALHQLAEYLGSDLYVLPSSIHETVIFGAEGADLPYLAQMVDEVNVDHVMLEERLSNNVYHYDREARKLSAAGITPAKDLEGNPIRQAYEERGQSR